MILSITLLSLILAMVGANSWNPNDESLPCWKPRGGAVLIAGIAEESSPVMSEPKLPSMNLKHISLSLRYACEMNRRLQEASHLKPSIHDRDYQPEDIARSSSDPLQMSGGGQMVHIHPTQTWQQPIRASEEREAEQLTIFHAKTPRQTQSKVLRGASRWGPDLETYIEHVTKALKVHDNPLVLSLAILYLDRASSVETPRSNGALACPYVSPRTVHRLMLVSLIIATKAVYHTVDLTSITSLGISEMQLEHMENWMRLALGDQGLYVQSEQLHEFFGNWERTWNKPKIRINSKRMRRHMVRPISQREAQQLPMQYPLQPHYYNQPQGNCALSAHHVEPSGTAVSDVALSVWA